MINLLKSNPRKARVNTLDLNVSNGNDAEILTASTLVMAIGAEISWGSRNEDGRKIDLICSYDHPWIDKERIVFFVQVKSGISYGERTNAGFKLKTKAKTSAQRSSHSICLIWVDRDTERLFWVYIFPGIIKKPQEYGDSHLVSPPMRFDIARHQSRFLPIKKGGSGIIMKVHNANFREVRQDALTKYKSFRTKGIFCPTFGTIQVTRIGWRHMLRKTRSSINKSKSFTTIKYLDQIIKDIPSEIYISQCKMLEYSNFQYRNKEYVLIYNNVKKHDSSIENVKVVIRIIEEIKWPTNWKENSTLTQFVERKLVLLSCYYK